MFFITSHNTTTARSTFLASTALGIAMNDVEASRAFAILPEILGADLSVFAFVVDAMVMLVVPR